MTEYLLGQTSTIWRSKRSELVTVFSVERRGLDGVLKAALDSSIKAMPPESQNARTSRRIAAAGFWGLSIDTRSALLLAKCGSVSWPIRRWGDKSVDPIHVGSDSNARRGFEVSDLVRPLLLDQPFDEPLYPYQRSGVAWLLRQRRALLADDMGLGKTLQVLAAARRLIRSGNVRQIVVVCPGTLVENWISEASKWSPELTCISLKPRASERFASWRLLLGRSHVLVTTYDQIRVFPPELLGHRFDLLVLDEAHRVRNIDSGVTQSVRAMKADRIWAITGTPIERDSEDLVALLSLLDPKRFSPDDARLAPSQLRSRARPYILRRRKEDVLAQLPPVIRQEEMLPLKEGQRHAYKKAIVEFGRSSEPNAFLSLFNRLRTICDFDEESGQSAKIDRIVELIEAICSSEEKVVVFSFLIRPLEVLKERLKTDLGIDALLLTGSASLDERRATLQAFKLAEGTRILLASSKIASEGLTLTEANHVIFVNRWWNPSQNRQAEDRVNRIGQKREVRIYTFVSKGTGETSLERILLEKQLTFAELVDHLSESMPTVDETGQFLLAIE